jgi:hypothetical protein
MKTLTIQSFLFARKKWTAAKADAWLKKHHYKTPPVDETADFLRYRQASPAHFRKGTFITKELSAKSGIKAVMAKLKAERKTKKKAPRRTAPTRSSAPTPNKKQFLKAPKLPAVFVLLGKAKKLELNTGHSLSVRIGAGHWDLFTDEIGKKLYIFEHSKHYAAKKSAAHKAQAKALYKRWSDFEPDSEYVIRPAVPKDWRHTGNTVLSIVYSSDKWTGKNTSYFHHFDRPPKIITGLDSKKIVRAVFISGQNIKVTKRGIEG